MKILFIQNRILFPTNTGGRVRTLNILRHLTKRHDITYLCNVAPEDTVHFEKMRSLGLTLEVVPFTNTLHRTFKFYCQLAFNTFSRIPFTVAKDFNPLMRDRAEKLTMEQDFDLVLCDFVHMAPIAKDLHCRRSLLFEHNVESQIFERHARFDKGFVRRWVMWSQWKKMFAYEQMIGETFDRVIAVSEKDCETFKEIYGWQHVDTVGTGVNVEYFLPQLDQDVKHRLLFVGSLDWLPNQDGVLWFVDNVWPLLSQRYPGLSFQIVGRNPVERITKLAKRERIEVIGEVSDVRPYLAQAAVVCIPILVGGGTRIKIAEAMAMGKSVVSTSIGAEGLPVTHKQDIYLADTANDFAAGICHLLENSPERHRMGLAAHSIVKNKMNSTHVAHQFENILQESMKGSACVR